MEPSDKRVANIRMDHWMSLVPPVLHDTPLYHLAIPGSHNAITYCLDRNSKSPVDVTQPDLLLKADKYTKGLIRPLMYNWAITQDLTVTEQLDTGIRYLDLRIAHRPNDNSSNLYFYHGFYTKLTVELILQQIRKWLDNHRKEVVILSFSHFLDLSDKHHLHLVYTIQNIFSSKLCPRTETPTLRNLWKSGRQVIVSYEESSVVSRYINLWNHIPYWWANKIKASELIEVMEYKKKSGRPGDFFVAGMNLTVDAKHIGKNLTDTLKDLVTSTNATLLPWVLKQKPGNDSRALNIVAGDFISEGQFPKKIVWLNNKLLS